jgi:predicted phosphohydrolase
MKIQYCSDLHLEFPDNKEYILDNPLSPEADILILAGDIIPFAVLDKHNDFLDYISRNFKTTFWVPGNHEYYYYNVENSSVLDTKIRENIFVVNNCVKEIEGVNFKNRFSNKYTPNSNDIDHFRENYLHFNNDSQKLIEFYIRTNYLFEMRTY